MKLSFNKDNAMHLYVMCPKWNMFAYLNLLVLLTHTNHESRPQLPFFLLTMVLNGTCFL